MKIKIYQIDYEKDKKLLKFESFEDLKMFIGTEKINSSMYNEVFSGDVEANYLEDIFRIFNDDEKPGLFRGHSLSVSDIVQTEEGTFYCDKVGFKKVEFDASLTTKPTDLLRVIYVEPGKRAVEGEMERGLNAIQRAVKGYYEQVYLDENAVILCNEEAKLNGMKGNRRYNDGKSIIAGPFVIVGAGEEDYESLTDEQFNKYMERFIEPEDISDEETMADCKCEMIFW